MPKVLDFPVTKKTLLVHQPDLVALKEILKVSTESEAVRTAVSRALSNEKIKQGIRRIRARGRY